MSASSMASSLPRITRRMAPCNWEIREEVAVVMVMAALSLTRPRAFATNDVHKRSASAAHLVMLPGPWAISSVVRAPASHAGGQRFKSFIAHHQAFSFCPKCARQRNQSWADVLKQCRVFFAQTIALEVAGSSVGRVDLSLAS